MTLYYVQERFRRRNRKTEEVYNLPKKELVEWGYSLLDEMREDYAKMPRRK